MDLFIFSLSAHGTAREKGQKFSRRAEKVLEQGQRKFGTAIPKRDRGKKEWLSRCGTGILKTKWGFPDAGQHNQKRELTAPTRERHSKNQKHDYQH